jgi:hypothetical protein
MADEATYDHGNDKPMVWVDDEGITHYRASSLGGCTTAAILVRSGFTAMAPPDSMQKRFNEGHLHEPDIVRRANTEFGLEVFAKDPATNQQWTVNVPVTDTVVITGHTDGKCLGVLPEENESQWDLDNPRLPGPDEFRLFEAKTMSSAAFKRWSAMDWPERWTAYPGYAKQLTCYLRGLSILDGHEYDKWVYAIKDKESGQMLVESGYGEPYPWAAIVAQILGIEAHVRNGLPIPESCPRTQWPCPVFYIGPCGEDERVTLDERVGEVVVQLGRVYEDAKEAEKVAAKTKTDARDEIKKHLPDGGKYEFDGWKVAFSKKEPKGTTTVTEFDMDRFIADHPDIHEQYLIEKEVTKWSQERLTVTPPKDKK